MSKTLFSNYFGKFLLRWNRQKNTRSMPWKGEKDPYRIWLSEIILQQTRVEQGLKYYENFVTQFPGIVNLAEAEEKQVFKLWEGLGYYSRCRNLIATAKFISKELKGEFPSAYEEIVKLKGVGPYTAAAIASFAFNLPHAVIDGNVFRVLARVFGIETPIDSSAGKKLFAQLANELLDKKHPGAYNQAIMDFGATVCKPVAPLCNECVFKKECVAYKTNKVNELPVKEKKVRQKNRHFYFFLLERGNEIAVRERMRKDIWRHLHEFPLVETAGNANIEEIIYNAIGNNWLKNTEEIVDISEVFTQKLTHQTVKGTFIIAKCRRKPSLPEGFTWVKKSALSHLAFPKMIRDFLAKHGREE